MNDATMLYRPGGEHEIHGYMVSYVVVDSGSVDELLDTGWFRTPTEAGLSAVIASLPEIVEVPMDAPPTRAEMEQKANELGLKFDGRTSDKRLAVMISDKLKEQQA